MPIAQIKASASWIEFQDSSVMILRLPKSSMMMFASLRCEVSFGSGRRVRAMTSVISSRFRRCCSIIPPMDPVAPVMRTFMLCVGLVLGRYGRKDPRRAF